MKSIQDIEKLNMADWDRIGLTERELTAIGHDNPLRLIGA